MLSILVVIYSFFVLFKGEIYWSKTIWLKGSEARLMALYFLAVNFGAPFLVTKIIGNILTQNLIYIILMAAAPIFYALYKKYVLKIDASSSDSVSSDGTNATWEIVKTIVIVVVSVVFFRMVILQPFYVIGSSMVPNYHESDYLFIDEASYFVRQPSRGEVIVFSHPEANCNEFVEKHPISKNILPSSPCRNYIKRVIGLPGETVEVKNGIVKVFNKENPNGFTLNENYLEAGVKTLGSQRVTVGANEFYVLGDNRQPNASSDSREWGVLNKKFIIGRAWLRLLPPGDMGFLGKAKY